MEQSPTRLSAKSHATCHRLELASGTCRYIAGVQIPPQFKTTFYPNADKVWNSFASQIRPQFGPCVPVWFVGECRAVKDVKHKTNYTLYLRCNSSLKSNCAAGLLSNQFTFGSQLVSLFQPRVRVCLL